MVKKKGETTYQVTVDYGMTLKQMIAAGRYDTWDKNTTAVRFPLSGTGQMKVELHLVHLVHMNRMVSTNTVLTELDSRNLRPATIEELLALGAKYPNLQKKFTIVALGSVWRGLNDDRCVACLECWVGKRELSLSGNYYEWAERYSFLAVSK